MPAAACATYVPPASDWHLLTAPPHWRAVDFISDVHLHSSEAATANAWRHYLQHTTCDALFILGDLFEVWIGDDMLDNPTDTVPEQRFLQDCCNALRACAQQRPVYVMCGNRDFLLGRRYAQAAGLTLLPEICTIELYGRHYLISHGDEMCTDDVSYQRFRSIIRNPWLQKLLLALPQSRRRKIAAKIRAASKEKKQAMGHTPVSDVTESGVQTALNRHPQTEALIHGHTHRPAEHEHGFNGRTVKRYVLPDWYGSSGGYLKVSPQGAEILMLELA